MGKLILLSGPSCVGKGPLVDAVNTFRPDVKFRSIDVIKSLESRPGGLRPNDNHADFRSAAEINSWRTDSRYIVGDCRGLPQAVDLEKVHKELAADETLLIEAYYTLGRQVRGVKGLGATSIFISPLSQQEIDDLQAANVEVDVFLTNLMMCKQLARARAMGKTVDTAAIEDIQKRAQDIPHEMAARMDFTHQIVNRDGEGHPNWHYDYTHSNFSASPEGDAGRAVARFSELLLS